MSPRSPRPEERLGVMVTGRGEGKTTETIRWVLGGERVPGYPGWSRVLVVPNLQQFDLIRKDWWGLVSDFDHRIYTAEDWRKAHGVRPDTEVCIDNADWMLDRLPGHVTRLTMNGWSWQPQTALRGSLAI